MWKKHRWPKATFNDLNDLIDLRACEVFLRFFQVENKPSDSFLLAVFFRSIGNRALISKYDFHYLIFYIRLSKSRCVARVRGYLFPSLLPFILIHSIVKRSGRLRQPACPCFEHFTQRDLCIANWSIENDWNSATFAWINQKGRLEINNSWMFLVFWVPIGKFSSHFPFCACLYSGLKVASWDICSI